MPWDQVLHKWKAGTLKSGGSGKPVRSQDQALAIMFSEKKKADAGNTEYQASDHVRYPGAMSRAAKRIHV